MRRLVALMVVMAAMLALTVVPAFAASGGRRTPAGVSTRASTIATAKAMLRSAPALSPKG